MTGLLSVQMMTGCLDSLMMSFLNSLSPILLDQNLRALSPSPHLTCQKALFPRECHPDLRDPKTALSYSDSYTEGINGRTAE